VHVIEHVTCAPRHPVAQAHRASQPPGGAMQASAVAASGVQTLHSIIISREISPSGFRPRDNSARRGREEEGGGWKRRGGGVECLE